MTTTSWNDAEDDAMQYLHPRDQVLYLRGLRRHMDYATGVVGFKRRVSLQMFKELLEVHAGVGSHDGNCAPTPQVIRTSIDRLERAGLLVRLPKKNKFSPMLFRLPLASTDSVRVREEQQESNKGATNKGATRVNGTTARVVSLSATKGTTREQQGRSNIPPVSDIKEREGAPVDKFLEGDLTFVPGNFLPNKIIRARCKKNGCPPIDDDCIEEFKAHHGSLKSRYEDWQECFYKWMLIRKKIDSSHSVNVSRGTPIQKKEDWEKVPADPNKLWEWAKRHNYPDPGQLDNYQYRKALFDCVDERRKERERIKKGDRDD